MPERIEESLTAGGNEKLIEAFYCSETKAAIEKLRADPKTSFDCLFGDGPAAAIVDTPGGCYTRVEAMQPLCLQHLHSGIGVGLPAGEYRIAVDLTIGGALEGLMGVRADHVIEKNGDGQLELS